MDALTTPGIVAKRKTVRKLLYDWVEKAEGKMKEVGGVDVQRFLPLLTIAIVPGRAEGKLCLDEAFYDNDTWAISRLDEVEMGRKSEWTVEAVRMRYLVNLDAILHICPSPDVLEWERL